MQKEDPSKKLDLKTLLTLPRNTEKTTWQKISDIVLLVVKIALLGLLVFVFLRTK